MATNSASTVLQAVAQIRNWVVTHIPLTGSLVGYDLFLLIGAAHAAGKTLALAEAHAQLAYGAAVVDAHVAELVAAGLIEVAAADAGPQLVPTARFDALLREYQNEFDRRFIARDRLHAQQLLCVLPDAGDRAFVELLYDRFFDLGWFYLHNYGSTCFMMATMVERVARLLGRQARMQFGTVTLLNSAGETTFRVGAGSARPGQVDGHAFCVIDERFVLDFGLGSIRKFHRRDFAWAAAVPALGQDAPIGGAKLADGTTVVWTVTPLPAGCEHELQMCLGHADVLLPQYLAAFPAPQ